MGLELTSISRLKASISNRDLIISFDRFPGQRLLIYPVLSALHKSLYNVDKLGKYMEVMADYACLELLVGIRIAFERNMKRRLFFCASALFL